MRFWKKDILSKNNYAEYRVFYKPARIMYNVSMKCEAGCHILTEAIAIILTLDFNKQFHKQFIILHDISEVDGRINEGDTHHFHTNKIQ